MYASVFRHARVPLALAATAAAVGLATAVAPAVASAHVTANAQGLSQGGYGIITFRVPNESGDKAVTNELTVTLPNLKSARTEPIAGWKAVVTKDPTTDEATSITWTALPGSPGIGTDEFGQFVINAGPLPKEKSVTFPAVQKYSDGTTVDWNQPPNADGSEPDHPAPEVELAPAKAGAGDDDDDATATAEPVDSDTSDVTARWLGGVGIAVGVLGVAAAGVAIRRKQ